MSTSLQEPEGEDMQSLHAEWRANMLMAAEGKPALSWFLLSVLVVKRAINQIDWIRNVITYNTMLAIQNTMGF